MSEEEIHDICAKYKIKNYTINLDGSIDINGSVHFYNIQFDKVPIKFNKVSGDFNCSYNILTTMEGFPKEVGGTLYINNNKLSSFKFGPIYFNRIKLKRNRLLPGHFQSMSPKSIKLLFKHQEEYGIWNKDGKLNDARLKIFKKDYSLGIFK